MPPSAERIVVLISQMSHQCCEGHGSQLRDGPCPAGHRQGTGAPNDPNRLPCPSALLEDSVFAIIINNSSAISV